MLSWPTEALESGGPCWRILCRSTKILRKRPAGPTTGTGAGTWRLRARIFMHDECSFEGYPFWYIPKSLDLSQEVLNFWVGRDWILKRSMNSPLRQRPQCFFSVRRWVNRSNVQGVYLLHKFLTNQLAPVSGVNLDVLKSIGSKAQ
jgi:hypothetical protein